jgi:tetratricopeptide (TPR) repeat protein
LAIIEKQGDEHAAGFTYYQLGTIADEQGDFKTAEEWYRKALAISEKQGDEHAAAMDYGQLGRLAGLQEHYEQAGRLLVKAFLAFVTSNDLRRAQVVVDNFVVLYKWAGIDARSKLKVMWEEAALGPCLILNESLDYQ